MTTSHRHPHRLLRAIALALLPCVVSAQLSFAEPSSQSLRKRASHQHGVGEELRYLVDLPEEVISIVQQLHSFDELERWLEEVLLDLQVGGRTSHEVLSVFEKLTLLFGFESKPDKGLVDSMGSILKNMQVADADKERIWEVFYNQEQFESGEPLDQVKARVSAELAKVTGPQDQFSIFSRIKQYQSLLSRLESSIFQLEGAPRDSASLSAIEVLERALQLRDRIADDPIAYFDDLIGFNFIIDDTNLDERGRTDALTEYSTQVEALMRTHSNLRVTKVRKESRVPGFEAVNLFVQGWLNHRDFGALPIKIQFRFKTALYRESAMYYTYKTYGRWELPPWAKDIDFRGIRSFREVQETLFDNFRQFIVRSTPTRRFSMRDHLTMPPGWPSWFDAGMTQEEPERSP